MRISAILAFAALAGLPLSAHAATSPGAIVKGSGDAVYAIGPDGKRYVFPTAKTYLSWYSDFAAVQALSDAGLSAIPLGGNVTYRPGARLVKVTTDPKVYAVAGGGVLRWIESEAVAVQLYGNDWAKKIDDLPDAFFVNYRIGASIPNAGAYAPPTEMAAASTIVADISARTSPPPAQPVPTTPVPTPSSTTAVPPSQPSPVTTFSFSVSATSGQAGDVITLSAQRFSPDTLSIRLAVDGVSINSCPSSACVGEFRIPFTNGKTTYRATATVQRVGSDDLSQSIELSRIGIETKNVRLEDVPASLRSGDVLGVRAVTDLSIGVSRTDIYVDGASVHSCVTDEHTCVWGGNIVRASGSSVSVQAITTDPIGRRYASPVSIVSIP
jgi:hypothetical protein